jgi:hypothetical protein
MLTWSVLPREVKDSPHHCGQALTKDLLDWRYPSSVQNHRATICRATKSFLKLSGLQGYKVSKKKAQLCLPQVTYLGVVLKGQAP